MPSALYILMKHSDDLEEAVVRAVNDTRDNDTVAAIVGAAVGALHGLDAIPERWKKGLSGCTRMDENGRWDDGKVFALLKEARVLWG